MAEKPIISFDRNSSAAKNFFAEVKSPDRPAAVIKRAIPQADLCDRLLRALEQAALDSSHSMEALRLAVCDFTAALREEGTTPEGVLISLKSVIHLRTLPSRPYQRFSDWKDPEIHERISTWSIEEFFREVKS